MDPYAVLGVAPGSSPEEVARAYRAKAKEWHPDIRGTEDALRRMALINAAYEQIRDGRKPAAPRTEHRPRRRRAGHWLPDEMRRSLGAELLAALEEREPVELVTRASTWASPQTLLAVTDRRLLWLLDDAVGNRVRSLRFRDTAHAEQDLVWPRRTRARLRVQPRFGGKRWTFSDLRPATAEAIAGHVRAGLPVARPDR